MVGPMISFEYKLYFVQTANMKALVYSHRHIKFSSEKQYTAMWQVLLLFPSPEQARPYFDTSERKL